MERKLIERRSRLEYDSEFVSKFQSKKQVRAKEKIDKVISRLPPTIAQTVKNFYDIEKFDDVGANDDDNLRLTYLTDYPSNYPSTSYIDESSESSDSDIEEVVITSLSILFVVD